jgi:ion channel POLLUX/CASTOR
VSKYVKTGEPLSFYNVLESASLINETALGYRITSDSRSSEKHFGVKLNPQKSELVTFSPDDFIIVLAED